MQKIIVCGAAGRMGQRLAALIAADPQLQLTGAVDAPGHPLLGVDAGRVAGVDETGVIITDALTPDALAAADALIDFSAPAGAVQRATAAVDAGCAVVVGTTGLADAVKAELSALGRRGRLVVAPNMSVGINLLFALCAQVAETLGDDYDIEVVEMHHKRKKDAPSGTAERLGEILAAARGLSYAADTAHGRHGMVGARPQREIGMHALRGGDVVGDHTVIFATAGERVELAHHATSRDTFARGALRAVKFLADADVGCHSMRDVLHI